jgi:lipoprotein-anchoring transpeptidase ErfK/SrfK
MITKRVALHVLLGLVAFAHAPMSAFAIEAQDVLDAKLDGLPVAKGKISGAIVKAQILLDRRSISPGVIDGHDGENFRKALAQFRTLEKLGEGDALDDPTWAALGAGDARNILSKYTITEKDAAYEFADKIPQDYSEQARMKRLAYTSPVEMLAERFHMDDDLLKALNPKARFDEAGAKIIVANVERTKKGPVARLDADKARGLLIAYGDDETILASYPATIGSSETPSPSGEAKVTRIARNPTYHYDPDKNFKQGKNTEKLMLPPGPNNPVGSVWIALSKPTYGLHGTPEPSKVSKNASHGCVRLTNWDAEELADLVRPGVIVRFQD